MARKLAFDRVLLTAVVLILGFGLVMVYSASAFSAAGPAGTVLSSSPFQKQLLAAAVGLIVMVAAMQIDYHWLRRPFLLWSAVGGAIGLLIVVLYTPKLNEAHRWLFIGGLSVQPSELAKLAVVLYIAFQLERSRDAINQPSHLVPTLVVVATISVLILLQPDFGTAGLVVVVAAVMLFLGGLAWRWVALTGLLALPAFWVLVMSVPYRRQRLASFLEPGADPLGAGFQAQQSLIAIGSGGLSGLGMGQSVQKLHFLPFANSDFIFAILAEELGFLGGVLLLLLFAVLAWRGLRAGTRAPDMFGRYLAWGLTATLVLQVLLNVSIATSLLPTTGTPLPLISAGGTSLVASLAACGLLLNISQHA